MKKEKEKEKEKIKIFEIDLKEESVNASGETTRDDSKEETTKKKTTRPAAGRLENHVCALLRGGHPPARPETTRDASKKQPTEERPTRLVRKTETTENASEERPTPLVRKTETEPAHLVSGAPSLWPQKEPEQPTTAPENASKLPKKGCSCLIV